MARRRYNYRDFYDFTPKPAREVSGGLKARSQRGDFAENWWAARWIQALERLVDPRRLQRGRSYARRGQVVSIEELTAGVIRARVQGSRRQPYSVSIALRPLSDEVWDRVLDGLAEQAIFSAQLLAGEMPREIESVFYGAGASLFPDETGALITECSCPDWSNPCKHVAAVHYLLGERFDLDPFLLLRLRGRHQDRLLQELRERRAGAGETGAEEGSDEEGWEDEEDGDAYDDAGPPLEESLDSFWTAPEPLLDWALRMEPPAVDQPILRRLGEPAFVPGTPLSLRLKPLLDAATALALRVAGGGDGGEGEPEGKAGGEP